VRLFSVEVRDFRNLAHVCLTPAPRATVFVGNNGQGKTNLLEAIYFLCTLRPLRTARQAELIRFGAPHADVSADARDEGGTRRVAVRLLPGTRTASLDGKPQARLDAYFEGLTAVAFCPDDLLLVKGGPDRRRRFLDRAAFNRWPAVLAEAREYMHALRCRNAALRAGPPGVEASFRGPLVRAGVRILCRRLDLLKELHPRVAKAYAEISGPDAPSVNLTYRSSFQADAATGERELAAALTHSLEERSGRDRERGYTSIGPHADDLTLELDGHPARSFASQGQQRALVLALKVAEIENLCAALGRPPFLLLDDVSSELDPQKNRFLLDYLNRLPAQAFLTSTDPRLLEAATGPDTALYSVAAGNVERLN